MVFYQQQVTGFKFAFTDKSVDLSSDQLTSWLANQEVTRLAEMKQVHGNQVALPADTPPVADALISNETGVALMVRVADCVPVILTDAITGWMGAVHAGRAGVLLKVLPAAITELNARGATQLSAWIGPHICASCYEVAPELFAEVTAKHPELAAETSWGTPSLNLVAGITQQLTELGVPGQQIPGCTRELTNLHSYRRDGADSGRIAGLVWRVK